jgi:hypothetical protein
MSLLKHLNNHSNVLDEITMNDVWDKFRGLVMAGWGRTTRRLRMATAAIIFL